MRKEFYIGIFIGCFGFVASALAYPAMIVQVTDGDTLVVEEQKNALWLTGSSPRRTIIRLYGIDCPEKGQPYGNQATAQTRSILGQRVEVESLYEDNYGRTVAIIHLKDGTTLQEQLLRFGSAWVFTQFCKSLPLCTTWKTIETKARQKHQGLWSDEAPNNH